ncbi:MAG: hypothetical protein ABIF77_04120, partial [bacterium]
FSDARGLTFQEFQQTEIGGSTGQKPVEGSSYSRATGTAMLMSLILPGAGEVYLGHKRGYFMMALDVAVWVGVKHYHDKGYDLRDDYYAYADEHWSEGKLAGAFDDAYHDESIAGVGHDFFPDTWSDLGDLPLWVTREADEREYYENLGKWDQFVFGWDDFTHPDNIDGYDPPSGPSALQHPEVSLHREIYRSMRQESNDQFTKRDRLMYLNIATRVFSLFQVAYLQGMLGGGPESELKIAGHPVTVKAEPRGFTGALFSVSVAY